MNYIRHQTYVFSLMDGNANIKPIHISLYLALFRKWNQNRFTNPITINRQEMMEMSKIGSPNTYSKAMKELELYGFIRYHPSFDPGNGSQVDLYTFDTGTCTPPVSKVIHYNKLINNTLSITTSDVIAQNKSKEDTMNQKQNLVFQKPPIQHIQIYFEQKGHPKIEAERFFNYYESNGWLVGGKSKMKDWKAAARNWMLNIEKFQNRKISPQPANIEDKKPVQKPFKGSGYQEPL